ncbi:MAG: hypothetical protein BIFFINMI_00536 [Phycisphaerae bacterium]|nr:hypothetical protein [Phycisphaerae bacterium]
MSYTVLARRYRSKDFDDLIGQEPISQTLRNAIETNRVAHAYLFCGTRGVGKTSMARILAKALNCEKGPTVKPCNTCDRCKAIAAGEDIDVIEIDGASNRGIDDIRELRNNAIYRPARSPNKIYIIDEVHQVTRDAFNALLKTLEEPPDHVKFIFATTEPQKVPETIRSRCQEFSFGPISTDKIAARLGEILKAEKIKASPEVVARVARAGRGSMRDALSMMDQLLAMGADAVTEQMVQYLLGQPASERLGELVDALADGDAAAALTRTDALLSAGYAPEQFVVTTIEFLRQLMLLAVVGEKCEFLDVASADREKLAAQAARFSPVTLVYMIQLLEHLRQSVRASTTAARALIDAAMVRLALADQFADTAELVERLTTGGTAPDGPAAGAAAAVTGAKKKWDRPAEVAPHAPADDVPDRAAAAAPSVAANGAATVNGELGPPLLGAGDDLSALPLDALWNDVIGRLAAARLAQLSAPLRYTRLASVEGDTLTVSVRREYVAVLSSAKQQERLIEVLGRLLDRRVRLKWEQVADGPAPTAREQAATPPPAPPTGRINKQEMDQITSDGTIREVMHLFNAAVVSVEKRPADANGTGPK